MQSIPRIGLLLPHHRRPDLGGIAHPKLVSQLGQHSFKPLRVAGGFHAYAHWLLQSSVELLRLTVAMVESAFDEFTGFRIHHRNLLEARMKIYPYNQHTRLLSSESWSVCAAKFTRPGEEPTLLSNQYREMTNGQNVVSSDFDSWVFGSPVNLQQ